ncbi:MAG: hypothetical protein Q9162_000090 [Coniocarpon cinnabarinum]
MQSASSFDDDVGRDPISSFSTATTYINGHSDVQSGLFQPRRLSQSLAGHDSASPSLASKPSTGSGSQIHDYGGDYAHFSSRRLQSQYPQISGESHVEFILVAKFDIDKGSMMEHQYPGPISGNETMLAELMLPDQAHKHPNDWTIFFLHKDLSSEVDGESPSKKDFDGDAYQTDEHSDQEEADAEDLLEGPPLIYVLNHVITKHDDTVKRGAVCRAMAICTPHQFLDVFKPVLVLAIEQYWKTPTFETLAGLYESLNAMDLSLMPRLSLLERMILQASTAKDMFIEKFEQMIEQQQQSAKAEDTSLQLLPSQNNLPKDTHEFESRIYFNGHPIPVKIPTAKSSETVGNFSVIKLIQTFSYQNVSKSHPFAMHPHLTTNGPQTHPIIVLVNALLTQKRVVFLGKDKKSEDVAEAVLAACSLVSGGILRGFTRHAFPYTDLTKVDDLQQVPGFIAGVTNPIFEHQERWWDLLCHLDGHMKISSNLEQPAMTEGAQSFQQANPVTNQTSSAHPGGSSQDFTGDTLFMSNVLRNIENRLGEGVIRRMWREWIFKFTRITAVFEELTFGTSALYSGEHLDDAEFGISGHGYVWSDEGSKARELAGNVSRIEGWRVTRSYFNYKQDLTTLFHSRPIKTLDLNHHHDRLRTQKLSHDESAAIFLGFSRAVESHDAICQLLVTTSESHGGLFYVSLGLFHPQKEVRWKTVELLERIALHEAGQHFWEGLGRFQKAAFFRIQQEIEGDEDTCQEDYRYLSRGTTLAESVSS